MSVEAILKRLSAICAAHGITSVAGQLHSCLALAEHPEVIDIAVLGRFKAGKSSLLNSLAGQPVLPVGVVPVTSVITRLSYSEGMRVQVHFIDGRTQPIALGELASYVSEELNPENRKQVQLVDIGLPSLSKYPGLRFVDTPGLGSVFRHNTESSLDWLPQVGVALVAVSVDPPLSEQDVELIRQLARFTPKIVIVLTKADLLDVAQLEEVSVFVRKQLSDRLQREFPVYPFSIFPEHAQLGVALNEALLLPLVRRHDLEASEILRHKLDTLLRECEGLLRVALEVSLRSQRERAELRQKILGEQSGRWTRDQIQVLLRDLLSRTRASYLARLDELAPPLLERLVQGAQAQFPHWRFNLWKMTQAFEEWLGDSLTVEIAELSLQERGMFCAPLTRAETVLAKAVSAFHAELAASVEQQLGIRLEAPDFHFEVDEPKSPDISVGHVFTIHIHLLWFLIPMSLFRTYFERLFVSKLPYEVEKNLSRLASQWTERINRAILRMGRRAETLVSDQVRTFEHLLQQDESTADILRAHLAEVMQYRREWVVESGTAHRR